MKATSAFTGLSALALLSCSEIEIPEGPSLDSTIALYESPDGELQENGLEEVMLEVQRALAEVEFLGNMRLIIDSVTAVKDEIVESGKVSSGGPILLSGKMDVQHICPGADSEKSVDLGNGQLTFKLSFRDSSVLESIWGNFSECKVLERGEGLTINGDWVFSLNEDQPLSDFSLDKLLLRFDGSVAARDWSTEVQRDFRLIDQSVLELRIPASDGDVIFSFGDTFERAAVRTSDGSFCCWFDERECARLQSDSCEDETVGDQRISW